ncbi:MAG: protein rep [Sulfuricella denitrificans]|nr:protein rep [Sulfuricella denitrificans]
MLAAPSTGLKSGPRSTLGIDTKSLHRNPTKSARQKDRSSMGDKKMRYGLQRVAQSLLFDHTAEKQHRVCNCCRSTNGNGVDIFRTKDGKNARFGNLVKCGSVWHCAVCAGVVTEERRGEVQAGMNAWAKQGGNVYLMTLTFPHTIAQGLGDVLPLYAKAEQTFKNSKTFKAAREQHDWAGTIRGLEVTFGRNGWHPHTHVMIFAKDGMLDDTGTVDALRSAWIAALIKHGLAENSQLNDMMQHAFDLQGGDYAAEYIAKFGHEPKLISTWGAAREVTKGHSKIGLSNINGNTHATPFMLLAWYEQGDTEAGAKFVEYAKAFEGRRMLTWSPGLKAKLLPNEAERTDEELAAMEAELPEEELAATLEGDEWNLVLSRNARGELLQIAAQYGAEGVKALLEELRERKATHSGRHWAKRMFGGGDTTCH